MKNKDVFIIAGPCSINYNNIYIIDDIANIEINNKKVVFGTRIVGLKSRTEFHSDSKLMGIDCEIYLENLDNFIKNHSFKNFQKLPSIDIANNAIKKYNILVSTEIMDPSIQMFTFDKYLPNDKVMVWNPAVNQLGWNQLIMSKFCKKNNWLLGFKNPKTLGGKYEEINKNNDSFYVKQIWSKLTTYTSFLSNDNKILIHRGVEIPEKGDFRSALIHDIAKKVKLETGCKLFFDPSHSYGPKLRDKIPNAIIESLQMKINEDEYLYDGIIVETGFSLTDNDQHISVEELTKVLKEVSKFREFKIR